MPKFLVKSRLFQIKRSTSVCIILCLIIIIKFPLYGSYNYSHIPVDDIHHELYKEITPNLILKKTNHNCQYGNILQSKKTINTWDILNKFENFTVTGLANGSYIPKECNPMFSVALIVTYRNRQKQLDVFLPYIHNFLRKQKLHYKIYIVEQQDEKPWNKGILYNIGAKHAMADKFPCLILHDVDLLPLDESNLYACTNQPRHMSASIDKFRYVLTYDYLVGGVLAIRSDQYTILNGFSNRFQGWGGEDDDFAHRIALNGMNILRFPREMSRYTMLVHHQEAINSERLQIMAENRYHSKQEGLNSLKYQSIELKPQRLFTLIRVKL